MKHKQILFLMAILFLFATHAMADKTILAGGCFWCMESDFEKVVGVTDVVSGFTGGTLQDPTYNGNHEGHYEAVEITYDPNQVSYEQLLGYYWVNIDPFDDRGQFCDKGHSYLSAIFVANDTERKIAERIEAASCRNVPRPDGGHTDPRCFNFLPDQRRRELPPGFLQEQSHSLQCVSLELWP